MKRVRVSYESFRKILSGAGNDVRNIARYENKPMIIGFRNQNDHFGYFTPYQYKEGYR
jgi:hypothetical protein